MMDKYTEKVLANKDIYVIFYSDWCGYSQKALQYLRTHNLPYKGYRIDKIKGQMSRLRSSLTETKELTGFDPAHKTRPIIFHGAKFIGGYDELLKYQE